MQAKLNHIGHMELFKKELQFLINNFPETDYIIAEDMHSYKLFVKLNNEVFSRIYSIEIEHKYNESPSCRILKEIMDEVKPPELHLHPSPLIRKFKIIKGVHNTEKLIDNIERRNNFYYPCVYVNRQNENEWSSSYTIKEYILWIEHWFVSYEYWVLNGTWIGEEYVH